MILKPVYAISLLNYDAKATKSTDVHSGAKEEDERKRERKGESERRFVRLRILKTENDKHMLWGNNEKNAKLVK